MDDDYKPVHRHHKGQYICPLPIRTGRARYRFYLRRLLGRMRGQDSREDCLYCRRIDLSKARYDHHCDEVMRLAYLKHLPMHMTSAEYETFVPEDEQIF